jgi:hypothetical protein
MLISIFALIFNLSLDFAGFQDFFAIFNKNLQSSTIIGMIEQNSGSILSAIRN